MKEIELLSPAKNAETGKAAIDCGADAVYIGAAKFGARAAAGNNLNEIKSLADYAHKFYAKVYVTVNTLLYDNELEEAENLINLIYAAGADAIIIQDMAILEMNLPPLPVFASTQANNYSLERIKFLEQVGIQRVILARELSLEQIKVIRDATSLQLEAFIHGALCVSMSGQCYLSEYVCERSANRGDCSQPCRSAYDLIDSSGKVIIKGKHLLSLKDLNLSGYISSMIDAGVSSFKIEGRLKDIDYAKNITAFYREKIDEVLNSGIGLIRSSSGKSNIPFIPNPDKTFNRGYSSYFLNSPSRGLCSFDTAKSIGEFIGTVKRTINNYFEFTTGKILSNGDGICFTDLNGLFTGTQIVKTEGSKIFPSELKGIAPGVKIFRNLDRKFYYEIIKLNAERKINAAITFNETGNIIQITAEDEDGNIILLNEKPGSNLARDKKNMSDTVSKQLKKSGDSIFNISTVTVHFEKYYFIPVAGINEIRRKALSLLEKERLNNFRREKPGILKNNIPFPVKILNYRFNVTNKKAEDFYFRHGVEKIEPGFELLKNKKGRAVMVSKYCIKRELNLCPLENKTIPQLKHPLYLFNNKNKFKLNFDCNKCFMEVIPE